MTSAGASSRCSPDSMSLRLAWSASAIDRHVARPQPVRLLELALQRAAGQLKLRGQARPARLTRQLEGGAVRGLTVRLRATNRSTSSGAVGSSGAASSIRSTPAAHPEAGVAVTAELLDQSVIAPAARHPGLGPERVAGELEQGPRVVVETPDEGRVELEPDPGVVEQRAHLGEVLGILGPRADPSTSGRSRIVS